MVTYTKPIAPGNSFQLLGYADREHREVPRQSWETRATYDIEGQHSIRLVPRNQLLWGGGIRTTQSDTQPTELIVFDPRTGRSTRCTDSRRRRLLSGAICPSCSGLAASGRHLAGFSCSRPCARRHAGEPTRSSGAPFLALSEPRRVSIRTCVCRSTASSSFAAIVGSSPNN